MSNKTKIKKPDKNKKRNFNTEKEFKNEKVNKILNKFKEKQEIRAENHIFLWLILCPPYGFYRAIKYKAFSKNILIIFTIIMALTAILTVDIYLNPNRVMDNKAKSQIEKYQDIGDIRDIYEVKVKDSKYVVFNAVTSKGLYEAFFSTDGKLTLEMIKSISPEKKDIYINDNANNDKNIFAEIIKFLSIKENNEKYGTVEKVLNNSTHDNSQELKTTKGIYTFNVAYGDVVSVFKKDTNKNEYSQVFQSEPNIEMPKYMLKAINKNKKIVGEVDTVVSYNITPQEQSFIFKNKNKEIFKISKYLNGNIEIFKGEFK